MDKVELLNQQISDLQTKSSSLEMQNWQLKNDKHELQKQVQDLLKMLKQVNPDMWGDEFHKRFKIAEFEESEVNPVWNDSSKLQGETGSEIQSDSSLEQSSEDVLSFSEEDIGIKKTEKWLNQNDILNNVNHSSQKHRNSSTNAPDDSFSSYRRSSIEEIIEEKKEFKFVLERENNSSELFGNLFGETVGNLFSHATFLTLTIVMWLILWLWGSEESKATHGMRDAFATVPGTRSPMTSDYYEIINHYRSYIKIGLITAFMIGVLIIKWGGFISTFEFDPRKSNKKAKIC